MPRPAAAQSDDWKRALEGLEFPISMIGLIRHVRMHGGIDEEVLQVLGRIPEDAEFDNEDLLLAAIREIYVADGVTSPI